jgi:hypothetical protein
MTETPIEELQHLREVIRKLKEQLGEADNALLFYSQIQNYAVTLKGPQSNCTYQNGLKDDFETASNDDQTLLAGRRAREYFKRYEK